MARYSVSDPIREIARGLASSWQQSYLLRADPSWWYFEPTTDRPQRRQGWKLHVSTVPVAALETVRRVGAVVMSRGLRWKVAGSLDHLVRLCSPPSPVSQVGKFITVYAEDDDVAELAAALHDATAFFDGPVVPSDRRYRPGSNVYLRYGAFTAMSGYHGPDQVSRWLIVDPAGRRVEDRRTPGEHAPPWLTASPVPAAPPAPRSPFAPGAEAGLFGRGLSVRALLNQSAKGGVYRCTWRGREVVLKEARIGTCADLLGRDARSRLRNEWHILTSLTGTGLAPEPLDFFYAEDNAYLVEEFLPGTTLREHIDELNYCGSSDPDALLSLWERVATTIGQVRAHGVRLHDLTANNLMVSGDRCAIIDLEHAAIADSPEPRFDGRTPGYARPGHEGGSDDAADVRYALAAIAHVIFTGMVPFLDGVEDFASHVDAVLREFGPDPDGPAGAALAQIRTELAPPPTRSHPGPAGADQVVEEAVAAGRELAHRVEWDRRPWPWPERWSGGSMHPASFMSGTAGIVAYYLDLWRATGDQDWVQHADDLLAWTFDVFPFIPGQSPTGLYFGLAALPWLMADLAEPAGGRRGPQWLLRADQLASDLAATVVEPDVETWDITHGWAGLGLTEVALLRATGADGHRAAVARIVGRLTAHARKVAGLPVWRRGEVYHYGFGHGSAGIGYFLLHAGRAIGDDAAVDLAVTTGRALLDVAVPVAHGRGQTWRHGPQSTKAPWTHWCNGAAGVGQFLLPLWSSTEDTVFRDAAVRAGRAISLGRAFGSCCRCHGLAGDGDYLLDLADALDRDSLSAGGRSAGGGGAAGGGSAGGDEFRAAAARIGRKLDALKLHRGLSPTWPHEGDGSARPGYMRGYTGIHAFRLRLAGRLGRSPLTLPQPLPMSTAQPMPTSMPRVGVGHEDR